MAHLTCRRIPVSAARLAHRVNMTRRARVRALRLRRSRNSYPSPASVARSAECSGDSRAEWSETIEVELMSGELGERMTAPVSLMAVDVGAQRAADLLL